MKIAGYLSLILMLMTLEAALVGAQPGKPHRVGIVHPGGSQHETIEGLRQELKELGWAEGKQIVFDIRDVRGEASAAAKEAEALERENVALMLLLTTPVITKAVAATAKTPIVFAIGSDPVTGGLVNSFARPGGRLTGVHYLVRDLTGKRLEILKEILPKTQRVLTFYDPENRVASEGAALAREEAKRLGIKLIERHVRSVDEVKAAAQKLKAGEADAFLFTPDPMVGNQWAAIIEAAKTKMLPTMFQDQNLVVKGALASYGQNYREIGRATAKYVQQVLNGGSPKDMKIDTIDSVELAVNLQTAKRLGVVVPPQILARAQKVIR